MANGLTIEDYLRSLDHHLRHHGDRADLMDEIEDHLRSSVERQMLAGIDRRSAEADALHRFGDPDVIGEALAAANGSPAVPTSFTKTAGVLGMVGAVAWLAFPALWWVSVQLDQTRDWNGSPQLAWLIGTAALLAGMATSLVVGLALNERHGGLGRRGVVALGTAAMGLAAAVMVGWFIYSWSALLLVATVLVTTRVWSQGLVPRAPLVIALLAWPLALAVRAWLAAIEFGAVDEFGDRWEANVIGLGVGGLCTAMALIGVGSWLAGEEPVDTAHPGPIPA